MSEEQNWKAPRQYPYNQVKLSAKLDPEQVKLAESAEAAAVPAEVDLEPGCSPVVDQGQEGSCTANAMASGLREYMLLKSGAPLVRLSRNWLYWHERQMEGTISEDAGAYIGDGMEILKTLGVPPEADYPYDPATFTQAPTAQAESDAAKYKIASYSRLTTVDQLQQNLAAGNPVVLGIEVYDSFEGFDTWCTGIAPVVDKTKEKLLGGHAILAVGYKTMNGKLYIKIRNSWGTGWGQGGYAFLPIDYWTQGLVTDMWIGSDGTIPPPAPKVWTENDFDWDSAIKLVSSTTIDGVAGHPVFDSPDFWLNLKPAVDGGTVPELKYVDLAFRKIAAMIKNHNVQ